MHATEKCSSVEAEEASISVGGDWSNIVRWKDECSCSKRLLLATGLMRRGEDVEHKGSETLTQLNIMGFKISTVSLNRD